MITFKAVNSPERAEQLRVLRNECAFAMTRDTGLIGPNRQRRFFEEKIAPGIIEGFLAFDGQEPVAYGLLVPDDEGRVWSSTGVKAERRGEGLGRAVTVENARRAHARGVPIWAEVRRDNAGQQRICAQVGYRLVSSLVREGFVVDVFRCDRLAPEYAA